MAGYTHMASAAGKPYTGSTLAQLQAISPLKGDMGYPSDSRYALACRVAGTWIYILHGVQVTPPVTSGWVDENSATSAAVGGELVATWPAASGTSPWRGISRLLPSAPYDIIVGMEWTGTPGQIGAGLKLASSDQFIATTSVGDGGLNHQKFTNFTTFSANYFTVALAAPLGVYWFRFVDDSADRVTYISKNRVDWIQIHTVGRTDFITADELFVCGYPNNATFGLLVHIFDYEEQ